MTAGSGRRGLLISKGWVQAVVLVVLFGFFVLGLLAYRAYSGQPPIPDRVVDPGGEVVFTGEDVRAGQGVFLRNGLMQYGSIFGHGAYLGPDFTADYLRRSALFVRESYGGEGSDRAAALTVSDFKENRYDPGTRTLEFTAPQAAAFEELRGHYGRYFGEPTTKYGLRPEAISDPEEIRQLTAYFAWSAWAASALRPGTDYTYTNNWPPEPLVENEPTANVVVWSVLSLIALLGGIGLLFAAFGRWNFLGWRGREQATLSFRTPGDVALTPAQRACAWFFLVMAALFLIQTFVGAASQHYRADLASFFGVDLAQWLPYNLMRTWHVQLAIFWVATSFLAAGIFLAPMIAGARAAGPAPARLRAARRPGHSCLREPHRGVGRDLRLHGRPVGLVRQPGLRVPRPRSLLAGTALDRPVLLGRDAVQGDARAVAARAHGQHAVAVLLRRPCDPGVLRRRAARPARVALHNGRLLAVLGRTPLGRGLPRALHDRHGRLHIRSARGRAREGGPDRHLSWTSCSTRRGA